MADTGSTILAAGLGGTILGAAMQWAQGALQARRDLKRQEREWSRDDRRLWAEHRQRIYVDTLAIARQWVLSLDTYTAEVIGRDLSNIDWESVGPWEREPELLADWKQRLAEIEFYGSEDVRYEIAKFDYALQYLQDNSHRSNAKKSLTALAELSYQDFLTAMRRDLGLPNGGPVELGDVIDEVDKIVNEALEKDLAERQREVVVLERRLEELQERLDEPGPAGSEPH